MRSINLGASFFTLPTLKPSDGSAPVTGDTRAEGAHAGRRLLARRCHGIFAPFLLLTDLVINQRNAAFSYQR